MNAIIILSIWQLKAAKRTFDQEEKSKKIERELRRKSMKKKLRKRERDRTGTCDTEKTRHTK